jgi:hypothetical protein
MPETAEGIGSTGAGGTVSVGENWRDERLLNDNIIHAAYPSTLNNRRSLILNPL